MQKLVILLSLFFSCYGFSQTKEISISKKDLVKMNLINELIQKVSNSDSILYMNIAIKKNNQIYMIKSGARDSIGRLFRNTDVSSKAYIDIIYYTPNKKNKTVSYTIKITQ